MQLDQFLAVSHFWNEKFSFSFFCFQVLDESRTNYVEKIHFHLNSFLETPPLSKISCDFHFVPVITLNYCFTKHRRWTQAAVNWIAHSKPSMRKFLSSFFFSIENKENSIFEFSNLPNLINSRRFAWNYKWSIPKILCIYSIKYNFIQCQTLRIPRISSIIMTDWMNNTPKYFVKHRGRISFWLSTICDTWHSCFRIHKT